VLGVGLGVMFKVRVRYMVRAKDRVRVRSAMITPTAI